MNIKTFYIKSIGSSEEDEVFNFFVLEKGQKKEKGYCENTKKPATSFPSYNPKYLLFKSMLSVCLLLELK